jgi:hypothetical protein
MNLAAGTVSPGPRILKGSSAIAASYCISVAAASVIILSDAEFGSTTAVIMFALVAAAGNRIVSFTAHRLREPRLTRVSFVWLIKLLAAIVLLRIGWLGELNPANALEWGYDPQRYYYQAQELIENGWSSDFASVNYTGVLYYYAAQFFVLGASPYVAAVTNAFLTITATALLIELAIKTRATRPEHCWQVSFLMLAPESVWFDAITSRDAVVGSLIAIVIACSIRLAGQPSRAAAVRYLMGALILALLGIAGIRPSMLVPVASALLVIGTLKQQAKKGLRRALIIGSSGALLFLGPTLTYELGGYGFSVTEMVQTTSRVDSTLGDEALVWAESSLGRRLIPTSTLESIAFTAPRLLLYILAPLPAPNVTLEELLRGSWFAWQGLLMAASAAINVILFPLALASLWTSIANKSASDPHRLVSLALWITLIAIAGGNLIIHERYRVMATPLLWVTAWLGLHSSTRTTTGVISISWFFGLALAALWCVLT